ncbi:MAG: inositol monophosphatase family protein [Bacillota bacterium]
MQLFLDAAVAAAREAGALIRDRLGRYESIDTKISAHDLVTDVDRASEQLLADRLLTRFPGHLMLGEEAMVEGERRHDRHADPSQVEYLWICDPIDGTTNFVYGVPSCTVSIALAHYGQPVLGVVYDPARDELFSAVRGEGAHLNGRRVQVRREERLAQALLVTGFPVRQELRLVSLDEVMRITPCCFNLRALGSAALHLSYVAAGRLNGFWERGLHPWDLAAGYVLVTEAGGRMTGLDGSAYTLDTADFIASNGPIHEEFRQIVQGES